MNRRIAKKRMGIVSQTKMNAHLKGIQYSIQYQFRLRQIAHSFGLNENHFFHVSLYNECSIRHLIK